MLTTARAIRLGRDDHAPPRTTTSATTLRRCAHVASGGCGWPKDVANGKRRDVVRRGWEIGGH